MAEIQNGRVCVRRTGEEEDVKDLEAGVAVSGSGEIRRPAVQVGGPKMWPACRSLGRFFCEDEGRHFLDACFLCKRPLGGHRDIFMYRGNTPFCSEECRQEQIDMDEEKEKNWSNLPMKAATSRKEQNSNATETIQVRTAGAIVAG